MAKQQFKLQLDDDLIRKLDAAANEFGLRSANLVAAEVIEFYLEFWEEAKKAEKEARERQRASLGKAPAVTTVAPARRKA